MTKISPIFHPTTVVLIDDNYTFIKFLQKSLNFISVASEIFDKPQEAIKYINKDTYRLERLEHFLRTKEESEVGEKSLSINLRDIISEVYNDDRFKQISVIVSDYLMPGINGLEVYQSIKNKPYIRRILLTGIADEKIATDAFNDEIIDKYFRKHSHDFSEEIHPTILQAQNEYFLSFYNFLVEAFARQETKPFFVKEGFAKLFNSFIEMYNIVEYYLLDNMGSFLMLDSQGTQYALFAFGEKEMEEMFIAAEDMDASDEIICDVKNNKRALCYFNPNSLHLPKIEEWEHYMYPIEKLDEENGYYAFLTDVNFLDRNQYISFDEFLQKSNRFED